ncbi:MAG TPA: MarR family transcriptional regulator [Actinomycetota bacterium]|nr:MarR family transcriptional regulator [Actinomycetota bacterium]
MAQSDVLLEELTLLSRDFFRLISDCLTRHADLAEISPTQFRALAFLVQRGPHNASDLAETLAVGRPAATKLVDRLVRSGMIRREPHPTDRRQVILEATGEGFEVVQAVQRCRTRRLAAVLGAIEPASRKALAKALPALTDALAAAAEDSAEAAESVAKRPAKGGKRRS